MASSVSDPSPQSVNDEGQYDDFTIVQERDKRHKTDVELIGHHSNHVAALTQNLHACVSLCRPIPAGADFCC